MYGKILRQNRLTNKGNICKYKEKYVEKILKSGQNEGLKKKMKK